MHRREGEIRGGGEGEWAVDKCLPDLGACIHSAKCIQLIVYCSLILIRTQMHASIQH